MGKGSRGSLRVNPPGRNGSIGVQGTRGTGKLLAEACRLAERGDLDEAARVCQRVLRREPAQAEAFHLLGVIAGRCGDGALAVRWTRQALAINAKVALWHRNLAFLLEQQKDFRGAAESLRRAVALDPKDHVAHLGLGNALIRMGALMEAAVSLNEGLKLCPGHVPLYNSFGVALERMGELEKACVCYGKALSLQGDYVEAHNNMGNALHALGRHAEACMSYEAALRRKPDFGVAWCNLGNALVAMERLDEAIAACRLGIGLLPEFATAHVTLGNACKEKGLLNLAKASYDEALRLDPAETKALNNTGVIHEQRCEIDEALASYRRAIEVSAGCADAYSNMLYLHAFTRVSAPEEERELARGWERYLLSEAERGAARWRADPRSGVFAALPRAGRKLRVGIVSAELGTHAVAEFLEPLLEQLDRERFHLTLFPTMGRSSSRAERIRGMADSFVSLIKVPDAVAAERVRAEKIDVLIDTTGHTSGCRLGIFAHRAAPVQCTYIGYWSTTGLTEMDWFISDPDAEPGIDAHFTEGLWRLPRIAVCYRGDASLPESGWAPDPEGTIWLGSFNKYIKMREDTLRLWARVLHAVPEAKLLLEDRTAEEGTAHARILSGLQGHGIGAERVEFVPYVAGHERHMRPYDRLDIALDTIPFNSGTTAFDALWMGVPLVALEGNWVGGRMASSVLKTLGRREWVARDEEEYVALVAGLARDVALRKTLRTNQRAAMAGSELCDGQGLARALENAFEAMYDTWLQGEVVGGRPAASDHLG